MRNWRLCSLHHFIYWLFVEVSHELSVNGDKWNGELRGGIAARWQERQVGKHWTLSAWRLSLVEKLDPITHQQPTWNVSSFIHSLGFKVILTSAAALTGAGVPCACQNIPSCSAYLAGRPSLCWCDFTEATLLTQLQKQCCWKPSGHLMWAESGSAKAAPLLQGDQGAQQQIANFVCTQRVEEDLV